MHNPLFPTADDKSEENSQGYLLPKNKKSIEPSNGNGREAAANVVRQKLEKLYAEEPAAKQELQEIAGQGKSLSKHQKFLDDLQSQNLTVAQIQTKWHEYYIGLPEHEKHEVWQEFYAHHDTRSRIAQHTSKHHEKENHYKPAPNKQEVATHSAARKRLLDARSTREVKDAIKGKVNANGKLEAKHHIQSLLFGLSIGAATLIILLFGLFNQFIIAPLIQPSGNVSATPIILTGDSLTADSTPKVIIPKINVEIPVDYNVASMEEDVIQDALDEAVVHYPSTVKPGEQGNTALFGHSSNNIFNPGKFKFAFVLLSRLEAGDMFYLTYNGQAYAYKVYEKRVVAPEDTWVLNNVEGKTATAALITCDPPGTTLKRLVVWGEQVSPAPSTAAAPTTPVQPTASETTLPGPPQSLWSRLTSWL